jgi:hypothetical protein
VSGLLSLVQLVSVVVVGSDDGVKRLGPGAGRPRPRAGRGSAGSEARERAILVADVQGLRTPDLPERLIGAHPRPELTWWFQLNDFGELLGSQGARGGGGCG